MKLNNVAANQNEVTLTTTPKGIADFETEVTVLFSYKTPVALHVSGVGFFKTDKQWSRTTSKHINQFVSRHGGSGSVSPVSQVQLDNLLSEVK